jgi:hypothetical protein
MSAPKSALLPVYDREKDGNPFFWIIQTAKQVRDSREPIRRLGVPNQKKVRVFYDVNK